MNLDKKSAKSLGLKRSGTGFLIRDFGWFLDHEDEIHDWLNEVGIAHQIKGVLVLFDEEKDSALFYLRFGG